MEFALIYRGPLKSNGSVADKHAIRGTIHRQMQRLWQQPPLSHYRPPLSRLLEDDPESDVSLIKRLGAFRFAPLVSSKILLVAELSITFLRPQAPGSLIKHGHHRRCPRRRPRPGAEHADPARAGWELSRRAAPGPSTQILPQPGGALVVTPGRPSTVILSEPGGGYLVIPRLRGRRRRSFRSPANSSRTRAIRHECRGS